MHQIIRQKLNELLFEDGTIELLFGTEPFDGERKCLDERLHSDAHNEWHFSHTHALCLTYGRAVPIYL